MGINRLLHLVLYHFVLSGTHTAPLLSALFLSSPVSAKHTGFICTGFTYGCCICESYCETPATSSQLKFSKATTNRRLRTSRLTRAKCDARATNRACVGAPTLTVMMTQDSHNHLPPGYTIKPQADMSYQNIHKNSLAIVHMPCQPEFTSMTTNATWPSLTPVPVNHWWILPTTVLYPSVDAHTICFCSCKCKSSYTVAPFFFWQTLQQHAASDTESAVLCTKSWSGPHEC